MIKAVASAYREAFSGLPREVWYLALAMFINRAGSMVLPFLALYTKEELGYSATAAGWMVGVYGVGSAIGSYNGGFASERWGPMRVQIGALLINAAGLLLLSRMSSYWTFAVILFLMSIAADAFRPANFAALTMLCPVENHRRAFALNRLAANLGFAIGPSIGGLLSHFSFQWLFWLDSATCLAAGVVMYVLLYHHHADLLRRSAPRESEVRQNPFGDAHFMIFVGLCIVCFSVFFQLLSTYPLYLHDEYGLNTLQIGILLALNPVLVGVCEMVLVHRIGHWNQMRTIAWGSLLMAVGFGILPFWSGFAYASFGVLIYTLGEMLMMPQATIHVAAISDEASRARYIAVYTTGVSLAFILGPLLFSWIYGYDHNLSWYLSLAIGLAVFAGFWILDLRAKPAEQIPVDQEQFLKDVAHVDDVEYIEQRAPTGV